MLFYEWKTCFDCWNVCMLRKTMTRQRKFTLLDSVMTPISQTLQSRLMLHFRSKYISLHFKKYIFERILSATLNIILSVKVWMIYKICEIISKHILNINIHPWCASWKWNSRIMLKFKSTLRNFFRYVKEIPLTLIYLSVVSFPKIRESTKTYPVGFNVEASPKCNNDVFVFLSRLSFLCITIKTPTYVGSLNRLT